MRSTYISLVLALTVLLPSVMAGPVQQRHLAVLAASGTPDIYASAKCEGASDAATTGACALDITGCPNCFLMAILGLESQSTTAHACAWNTSENMTTDTLNVDPTSGALNEMYIAGLLGATIGSHSVTCTWTTNTAWVVVVVAIKNANQSDATSVVGSNAGSAESGTSWSTSLAAVPANNLVIGAGSATAQAPAALTEDGSQTLLQEPTSSGNEITLNISYEFGSGTVVNSGTYAVSETTYTRFAWAITP
jgi:hypothetical protein